MPFRATASNASLFRRFVLALFVVMVFADIPRHYLHEFARRDTIARVAGETRHSAEHAVENVRLRLRRAEALHTVARIVARHWLDSDDAGVSAFAVSELEALLSRDLPPGTNSQVSIATPDGKVIWSSIGSATGLNIADRDYFSAIAAGGQARSFSAPMQGRATGGDVTAYAEAVRDAAGRLRAVTVVTFPSTLLLTGDALPKSDVPMRLDVVRPDGVTVAHLGEVPEMVILPELRAAAFADGAVETAVGATGRVQLSRVPGFELLAQACADAAPALAALDARLVWYDMVGALVAALSVGAVTLLFAVRRRALELAVSRRSVDAMRLVTDNIDEIVLLFELDAQANTIQRFVSPSIRRLLGMEPAELMVPGRRMPLIPEDAPAMDARLAALKRGEPVPDREFRCRDAAGEVRWFHVSTRRISDDPAYPGREFFIACWQDITARRVTEAELATRDVRLASLATNISGGLYDFDYTPGDGTQPPTLRQRHVSQGLVLLSGYSLEWIQTPGAFERMTGTATARAWEAFLGEVLREGQGTFEYDLTRADGQVLHLRDRARRIEGDPRGGRIVGFVNDISDEVELRERLVESARLALLGELAASIAHEINQPLSVIALRSAMLMQANPKTPLTPERINAFGTIIGQMVERVTRVVTGIREFARRDTAAPEPFDPQAACATAILIVEPHLKERPAVFQTATPPYPVMALGHAAGFEQVLINLFTNAIDAYDQARPGRERTIDIAITAEAGQVAVRVSDHAGGIPDHVLPRLFDAFFTTKAAGKGTGLGLAICQRIMTDMGGTISAANSGDGACFTLTLPVAG